MTKSEARSLSGFAGYDISAVFSSARESQTNPICPGSDWQPCRFHNSQAAGCAEEYCFY